MRVDDLTVEVRDRTLKRVGQVTPRHLDLKGRTKWCGVGEWTLTLPGDHPMVPYLSEPGSGLLVTGPEGVVVHPPTYSDWVEEGRNRFPNPLFVNLTGWAATNATLEAQPDGSVDATLTGSVSSNFLTPTPIYDVWDAGGVISAGYVVKNTGTGSGTFRVSIWNGAAYTYGPQTTLGPGESALIALEGVEAQAGAAYQQPRLHAVLASGQKVNISKPMASSASTLGAYVDGNLPSTDFRRYRWTGAASGSESVVETRQMTRGSWRETVYGPLFSGPTRTPTRVRNQQNPDGTFTFSGVTDEILLQGARAFPDPTEGDPQASSQSKANDTRTGSTENLLRQYVAFNVTFDQAPPERVRGLRQYLDLGGTSQNRGLTQQKSPRFQNLLELLQEMIAYDPSLGFRVVQVGDLLEFQVLDARDRTAFVRFDVENGTIVSEEVQTGGPIVTDAIVAGQGEGTARTIIQRRTPEAIAAENEWGVVFEEFIDQRDTDDLGELQQSGDEALLEGSGGTAVKMVPADDMTMQVNVDWRQGDAVTTVVSGIETVARVTEVAYSITSSGVLAGAALGDVSGFTQKDAESAKVQSIDSRVSNLERASAGPVDWARVINEPTAFPTNWATVSGKPTTFPPTAHTHTWAQITDPLVNMGGDVDASALPASFPTGISIRTAGTGFPASIGTVVTERHSAYRQVQWFYDRSAAARAWFRTANGGQAWQEWREVTTDATLTALEVPLPWVGNGGSAMAISSTGWAGVPGATRLEMPAYTRDLLVDVTFGAEGSASAGYFMIGASIFNDAGTWTVNPEDADPMLSTYASVYGLYAPFASTTQQSHISGSKSVIIPAGVEAVFQMAMRKSTSGATATLNYASIEVKPQRWV